jgi:hypothetical protein
MRHRYALACKASSASLLLSGLLLSGPALAYWELIPRAEGGVTAETNPYNRADNQSSNGANGLFADFRLDSAYRTQRDVVTLVPRFRGYQYTGSDDRLDDDDYSLDLNASRRWDTATASLRAGYRDNGIRTNEFNTAIPGQTSNDSQETWTFGPSFSYTLSARNSLQFGADLTDITYDASPTSGYYDYRNSNVQATWIHAFNEKTSALLSANGGRFKATDPYSIAENTTDSYGATIAVERKLTPTVTATVTLGSSHSDQDVDVPAFFIDGFGYFCLQPGFSPGAEGLCSISESSDNFVGGLTLRQASEVMTTTLEYSQSQSPRSNGTSVISDNVRLAFDRTLSKRFTGSISLLYASDSALGNYGREDRTYYSAYGTLRYRLTETLSLTGSYYYSVNDDDANSDKQTNNRLFLSLVYRGVGIRR